MQVRIYISALLLSILFLPSSSTAQNSGSGGLIALRPKLFTLRNSRVSFGLQLSGTFQNPENNSEETIDLKYLTGDLPNGYSYELGSEELQGYNIGLNLELYSPNSVLGVITGLEVNYNTFGLRNDQTSALQNFEIYSIRLPAYLKAKIGSIHSEINGIVLGGILCSLPLSYQRSFNGTDFKERSELSNTNVYFSTVLGLQYRLITREANQQDMERTRFWLFLRGDLLADNLFSTEGATSIVGSANANSLDFKDLNISIGLAVFFGG